jgi:hypothetical protein
MKKFSIYLTSLVLSILLLAACDPSSKTAPETTDTSTSQQIQPDSNLNPLEVLTALRDSADKAWTLMITSDDQKISDLKRLLLEISYCKSYNAFLLDSLTDAVEKLKNVRYDQLSMTDAQITNYDLKTDQIIARTKYLARTTEELPSHPIAETLYNDISQADSDIPLYRSLYDRLAAEYNEYRQNHLDLISSKENEFPPYPLFTIMIP